MAIRKEKNFVELETKEITLGNPVILKLANGDRVKTSPVQDYMDTVSTLTIYTRNSVYRMYK